MEHDTLSTFWEVSQLYSDGLLVEDTDRRLVIVNTAFCEIFGIDAPAAALRGVDCQAALSAVRTMFTDDEATIDRIEQIALDRQVVRNEIVRMRDGRILERDYLPLTNGGAHQGCMWIYRDVTEHRLRDAEAREQAAMRKAVIVSALDGIVTIDDNGVITEFNPAAEQLFGLSATHVLGRSIEQYVSTAGGPGVSSSELIPLLDSPNDAIGRRRIEAIGRNINGVEFPVELSLAAVAFRSESLVTVFIRDITERNTARAQLETQRSVANAVAESATWLLNADDVLSTVSRTLQHVSTVVGITYAAVFQHHRSDHDIGSTTLYAGWAAHTADIPTEASTSPQPWHPAAARWLNVLRSGTPLHGTKHDFPKAEQVVFETFAIQSIAILPIFVDLELWGVLALHHEQASFAWTDTEVNTLHTLAANIGAAIKRQRLTQALQASEAELRDRLRDLEEKRRELERATAMIVRQEKIATLGTITSGLAHELNSPLGAILNSAERLLQHDAYNDDQRRNLQLIERAALRSRDVVRKLLTASRPAELSGRRTCNVSDVLRDTIDLYGGHLRMHDINVTADIPDGVIAAIGFSELSQIMTNLLVNARDAVLELADGMSRSIRVFVSTSDRVYVVVEDNGPGISTELMPFLYDAFVTTKEAGKGTGLGLWIVRSLLDDANGDISVTNTGNGLRVTIVLPRVEELAS